MTMWIIIMWTTLAITGTSLLYLSNRVGKFAWAENITKHNNRYKNTLSVLLVFGLFAAIGIAINYMNAIVCAIYFAMIWLLCDTLFWIFEKLRGQTFQAYYSGFAAIVISILALSYGWYADHHVWKTEYTFFSDKVKNDIKIAMFADSHIGTTFNAEGFAANMDNIQAQNPDILIIAGDFVDDGTSRDDMVKSCEKLGKMQIKNGIYFVFGNHDNGYYGADYRGFSGAELISELQKNNVIVLKDENVSIGDDLYIIGRRDFSVEKEMGGKRKSMKQLMENLDAARYIIAADHQPADYKNQAESGVDLVVSGHTHGGQLFPFNNVGKWIGANDKIYGHEKRNKTDFIVTSGISDWAIKFKTGTKSEYVIINLKPRI